jgi:hypothetical protein
MTGSWVDLCTSQASIKGILMMMVAMMVADER